jgi:hypothetical protein
LILFFLCVDGKACRMLWAVETVVVEAPPSQTSTTPDYFMSEGINLSMQEDGRGDPPPRSCADVSVTPNKHIFNIFEELSSSCGGEGRHQVGEECGPNHREECVDKKAW